MFGRKKKPDPERVSDGFAFIPYGPYQQVWERQQMPDPGAMAFSFETLALPPYSPIGPGRGIQMSIAPTSSQLYTGQAVPLVGIPLTAGTMMHQFLINPGNA